MAVVSWGAPTLQFLPVTAGGTAPDSGSWAGKSGLIEIPGDDLLEGSSQLETAEGDERTIKNEKGVDVDSMRRPSSYTFTTSIIKTKAYQSKFASVNGVVEQNYAMRLIPEDSTTIGFEMRLVSVSTAKGWNAEQGSLENLTIRGLKPNFRNDTDYEICKDFVQPVSPSPGG